MGSFDWKAFVTKVAPFIGTALGGPLGGAAASALAGALGGDPGKTTDQQLAALVQNVTPEQLLALKNAENDFSLKMQALGFQHESDLVETSAKDRADARARETTVKDWTPRILAYGVVLAWVGINGFLLKHAMSGSSLPPDMATIIMRVLGTLDAALTFVLGYYFGSSAGSARKDELLQQSTPGSQS